MVISKIKSHNQKGKKLESPIRVLGDTVNFSSWVNDRAPNYLWFSLLSDSIGRKEAIRLIKELVWDIIDEFPKGLRLDLYSISKFNDNQLNLFFKSLEDIPNIKKILEPLLVIKSLPINDKWSTFLGKQETETETLWEILAHSILPLLDHQSIESTDCRWLYCFTCFYSGSIKMNSKMWDDFHLNMMLYPYSEISGRIRAMEITSDIKSDKEDKEWVNNFWNESKISTPCIIETPKKISSTYDLSEHMDIVKEVWLDLLDLFINTDYETDINPKRDASFGFVFYSLSLLFESILTQGKGLTIKIIIRTLAETYITFKYLIYKDNENLWQQYRVYGAGQAKLACLKLREDLSKKSDFIKKIDLEIIANEDIYMEYLDINVGNWANLNLRKISEEANCKEIYNTYYDWTSSYLHAQWGAVRDTVFITCKNPLHRLHRVPRFVPNYDNDGMKDVIKLVNMIIDLFDSNIHKFEPRIDHLKSK